MFTIEKAEYNSLRGVFSRAKFIVVGTHGTNGLIALDDSLLTGPTALPDNDNLRFIYFGPCEFGKKRGDWSRKYPRASIMGYDELTGPTQWRALLDF